MSEDERFKIIKDIITKAKEEKLNEMTLYCLMATMTDTTIVDFHKTFMGETHESEIK